jgi:glycolate oxidase iron-sulfur subunit
MLAGCVQPAMAPGINAATARVFDRIGISLVEAQGKKGAGCCGALRFHLADVAGARDDARATSTPGGRCWKMAAKASW